MKILQLKIELLEIEPKIWRRFLVSDTADFQTLHNVIQIVMGWESYHLYEFRIGNKTIAAKEDGFNPAEGTFRQLFNSEEFMKMMSQQDLSKGTVSLDTGKVNKLLKKQRCIKNEPTVTMNAKINELITKEGQKVSYTYDFGDNWEHKIMIEKILEDVHGQKTPICLAGERACPPEDCGSIPGYYELVEAMADKKHPSHKELLEWLGGSFDPEYFDITQVNEKLAGKISKKQRQNYGWVIDSKK